MPAKRNLLNNLARLGILPSQWRNYRWNTEYCENTSRLRAFIPRTSAKLAGLSLPRTAWVGLNRLWTGVGRFHLFMPKWDLAPSPNCKCSASKQTADQVLITHLVPHGARGLTALNHKTRCWLNIITARI